ncbi:hypothetical protein C7B63_04220 [Bacillus halotolerans]|uniref:DUF3311 domain-containing protein n=1 Tax=Bacillus TaxID=1386 RepID=UPI000D012430|nr:MULTISPECIES: DUF3311 domain-containing protein [Bacillus]MCK8100192.1 DUF3311 domain-containing protein [Bacillus sp. 2CMS4F]PRP53154.1 hypothetical protein C7B63_04220 [Bacillus halotolerans]PRP58375.1 hypothetical protein C7B66_14870 [Bacillus halotolerans]PRP62579.1 hypothetical protein C7B72_17290 [Bacillus halotolerans]
MKLIHILAALPFIGLLLGIPFANKVTPYLFGMPFILAYVVMWALLTSVLMAIVYVLDKENKREETE